MTQPITVKIGGEDIPLPLIMNFATLERVSPALDALVAATFARDQIAAACAFVAGMLSTSRPDLTVPEIKNRLRVNVNDGTDERPGILAVVNTICLASGLTKAEPAATGEAEPPEAPAAELPAST